jgi:molecular chaperone GrpE
MTDKATLKDKEKTKENPQEGNIEEVEIEDQIEDQEKKEKDEELTEEERQKKEKEEHIEQLEELTKKDLINQILDLEAEITKKEELLEEKSEKVKELEQDVKNWKDKYMRMQAEFENSQKRWEKSRQTLRSQTTANVLKSFLPLYDSFKKAISDQKTDDSIRQFYNQFMSILKFFGVEPLKTEVNDKFDYNYHEALSTIEKEDIPPNRILDVIQEGLKINNDVLRYAKVIISRKPIPKPEPPKETKKEEKEGDESETKEKVSKKSKEVEKRNENSKN